MKLTAIQCDDVPTFEAEQGSRAGHSAHAVLRLASVRAQTARAVLPRNDAMDVTRFQFLAVLVPLQHRLWHSDNLNSKCTPAPVGSLLPFCNKFMPKKCIFATKEKVDFYSKIQMRSEVFLFRCSTVSCPCLRHEGIQWSFTSTDS